MMRKQYTSVKNIFRILNFDLFPGEVYAARQSLLRLDRGNEPQLPVSLMITRVKQPTLYNSVLLTYDISNLQWVYRDLMPIKNQGISVIDVDTVPFRCSTGPTLYS